MTMDEFRATRRDYADLTQSSVPDADMYWPVGDRATTPPPQGLVYLDTLVIERVLPHWPATARARGAYYLLVQNYECITDDLPTLERQLYDFAVSEEYKLPNREDTP
jgi:hypothetical protein